MRFYEMFYGIEEKKMKEYIIPIEDIIVKPELFYAHCDRGNGKNPEILKEHVDIKILRQYLKIFKKNWHRSFPMRG